jgi:hypothetical protein
MLLNASGLLLYDYFSPHMYHAPQIYSIDYVHRTLSFYYYLCGMFSLIITREAVRRLVGFAKNSFTCHVQLRSLGPDYVDECLGDFCLDRSHQIRPRFVWIFRQASIKAENRHKLSMYSEDIISKLLSEKQGSGEVSESGTGNFLFRSKL